MNFNYDYFGLAEPARFYLCKTDNTIICELNGIDLQSVSYTKQLNNFDTIQFDVHRYVNCEESNGYDMLDEAMYIFVDGIGYFRMSYPEVSNDGFDEYKSVSAQSCECELALKTLKNFKINTGETDSYEYLAPGNVEETDEGVKIAKKSITLYDQYNPELSLLHLALSKVSGWKIGIVDQTVAITTIEEPTVNEDGSVTTKTVTSASKRTFDIDSKSVYAFLTQDVSKKFECIFEFDIIKREINVRDVDTYGKDSNVFISYRNLIQELNYSPAQENNILTRFDVRGADDLTIDAVNFGTSTIEDLSYYLNTKHHVSDDLVDHYNKWLKAIEEARKKYMYYNRQYNILMEKRDEVNNRVPNDGLNNNWKQFTVKELGTIKKKYTGYMEALKKIEDYWDSKSQKWLNKGAEQDYIAYQGILEIIDQTIKYKQASVTETEKEENNLDDLLEEWNTNWDLFGLAELKTKEKVYLQNIEILAKYSTEWENLSKDQQLETHLSKENYNNSRNKYLKYMKYEYGCDKDGNSYLEYQENPYRLGCANAIKERQSEYDDLQNKMDEQSNGMKTISNSVSKDLFMSEDEIVTLNKLYNETDYTNDNILIVSTDTAEKIINTQYELLKDAQTELSKVCQPQLSFNLTMDNIFAIPGFKEWQGNFDIGNYVHLSFDKNDQYFLKLRISSLTFNPCIIENDFQIEFTNMISYNGGRDDFAALLDESVSTAKSQVAGSVKSKLDTSGIEVSDSLIKALVNSNTFSGAVSNGVFDTISANRGIFNDVISKTINVQQLMAQSGLFETVQGKNGEFFNVLALDVNMNRAQVGTLAVDRLILRGTEDSIMYTFNDFLGKPEATNIPAEDYDKYFFNGKNIAAHTITADEIMAQSISASEITADDLRGINGWINLHDGTFAFYGKTNTTDEVIKNKNLIDTYIGSWGSVTTSDVEAQTISDIQNQLALDLDGTKGTSGESLKFKLAMNFTPTSLSQAQLKNKIEELEPYSNGLGDVLEDEQKKTLKDLITSMYYYIIWLDVNDKINKDKEAPSKLLELSDEKLISKFNAYDNEYISISNEILKIREYLTIKNSSESGLMAWDGSKLTVRGDIIATSLTLGPGVNIETGNISGLKDYVTTNNLEGKLKDYTTTVDMKKEGLAFIVSENGSIGNYDSSKPLPTDAKGYFCVNKEGLMVAQNAVVYGKLYSSEGLIAGWNITDDALSKGSGYAVANTSSNKNAYFGTSGLSISDKFIVDSEGRFTFGGKDGITYDGSKVAMGANISISWNQISGTDGVAKTGDIPTKVSDLQNDSGYQTSSNVSNYVNGLGFQNKTQVTQITKDTVNTSYVNALEVTAKYVYAENILGTTITGKKLSGCTGEFSGNITASTGSIGPWNINSDAIYRGSGYNVGGSGNAYFGNSGLSISNRFIVDSEGNMTATSGSIGNIEIQSDGLYGDGYLTGDRGMVYKFGISTNNNKHVFWAGEDAFYVDHSGYMYCSNANICGNITSNGGYIKSTNGTLNAYLQNGQLHIDKGDAYPFAFLGIDNDGKTGWFQLYNGGYSVTPPVRISTSGMAIVGVTNCETYSKYLASNTFEYRPPITTTITDPKAQVAIVCTSGTNEVLVRGKYNTDSYKDLKIKTGTSDRNLKKEIDNTNVCNALQQILSINHRQFKWKSSNEFIDLGYIAQELEEINPNMVISPNNEDERYQVDTFYMESLITKSIQEMYAELKAENKQLKQRIEYLEQQII